MRFTTNTGELIVGRSYRSIVERLAEGKFTPPRTIEGYRRAVAHRIYEMYGMQVDPSTDKGLVKGMAELGLLKPA